jgi:hypothetical protein
LLSVAPHDGVVIPQVQKAIMPSTVAPVVTGHNLSIVELDATHTTPNSLAFGTTPSGGVSLTVNGHEYQYAPGAVHSVTFVGGGTNDTIDVRSVPAGTYLALDLGSGTDTVTVGSANSLSTILGPVFIDGANRTAYDKIYVNDQATKSRETYTFAGDPTTSNTISRPGIATISYHLADFGELHANLGGGGNLVDIQSTPGVRVYEYINTGKGSDLVDVRASSPSNFLFIEGGGGSDVVRLGSVAPAQGSTAPNQGNCDTIQGFTNPYNDGGYTTLVVDDSGSPTPRTNITLGFTSIRGLTGGVDYQPGQDDLIMYGGRGGNTFNVQSLLGYDSTTLYTGAGNDTVNITNFLPYALTSLLTIYGQGGDDTLNVDLRNVTFPAWPTIVSETAPLTVTSSPTSLTVSGISHRSGLPATLAITFDATLENVNVYTVAHVLYGAFAAEYAATAQETDAYGTVVQQILGLPTSDEMDVPGVPGARMVTFQGGAIYWSQSTGAHVVYGAIGAEYAATAQKTDAYGTVVQGILGLPTSDEMNVQGVAGARMNTFQGGTVYWSGGPTGTGAHVVYGAIGAKYASLGGPAAYGLPTSDEADVRGVPGARMNTFERGGAIYWSPTLPPDAAGVRAYEVHGAIGVKYASLGGPAAYGLPTSDEMDDGPGGRISNFQRGAIYWSEPTGAVDSIRKHFTIVTTGLFDAFGGWVDITLTPAGQVTTTWHVHDSGGEDYDFQLAAVLKAGGADGVAIAMLKSGHVSGHILSTGGESDRDFTVTETSYNLSVKEAFGSFARGSDLQVFQRHRGDITGTLADIGLAALKWGVGTAVTPALPIIALGTELGSLISTGSLVPGARILEGVLWLAGPEGTLIALAADAVTKIGSREMEIPQDEYDWAQQNVFKGTLPPRDQILLSDTTGPGNRAFTFKNALGKYVVNLREDGFDNPWTFDGKQYGQTLIHELTHVWQMYHNPDLEIYAEAFDAKLTEITQGQGSTYNPGPAGPAFSTFNLEQQATIVERWYVKSLHQVILDDPLNPGKKLTSYLVLDDVTDPYFIYIAGNIRAGIP